MKSQVKVTVTEFEHDELVNLLSTALYGSTWFGAGYDKDKYNAIEEKHGDCFEDALSDMLLAGHKIEITDYEAEGENYSNRFVRFEGRYDDAVYEVGLEDFLKTASTKEGYKLVEEVLSGDGDYYTADAFLQRVVFGEEVYG
jgi:hypothetical protein